MALIFTSRRREPELVAPAAPTPHELKTLSDIDDQPGIRVYVRFIQFYRSNPYMAGRDPAEVVRSALAKALVFFYPLAGRLREGPSGKLVVECTAEGARFVEADADVDLDQFGPGAQPPIPCLDQLIHDPRGSPEGFLRSPLLSLQVTRLKCGGFVLGLRILHVLAGGAGLALILKTMAEIARGATAPPAHPVWARERLTAPDPPRVAESVTEETPGEGPVVLRMLFFGDREFSALRRRLRGSATQFELLAACLWRCRTVAFGGDPGGEVVMRFTVDARDKCRPPLPAGYYGNSSVFPAARATIGRLTGRPLGYAVELVRAAKGSVSDGCEAAELVGEGAMQLAADYLAVARASAPDFLVSDIRMLSVEADFGWGVPVYEGVALAGDNQELLSYIMRSRNGDGEDGLLVSMHLPARVMERFETEMKRMVSQNLHSRI